jgi:GTP cyclohydrolase I
MVEIDYKKVICQECQLEFYKITNTHLWNMHRMTKEEYLEKYPNSEIEDKQLALDRQQHKRGKSYEEIYGKEEGEKLRVERTNSAIAQFMDKGQRQLRSIKSKGKIMTEEAKKKLSESQYINGENNYRKKAIAFYGEECKRCGTQEKILIHHVDGNRLNNCVSNLIPLCYPCHKKLHKEMGPVGFTGIDLVEKGMIYILKGLEKEFGLDIKNENFKGTPKRVARAYYEIFSGINADDELHNIAETSFPSEYGGMIIAKDIECFSMCPHHFLPVEYIINVGYIPDKKTVGISKLSRIVEVLAKRPELQEMFTEQIARTLEKELQPLGVIVQVKGRHLCMAMRGVKQRNSWTLTSSIKGVFKSDSATKEEFALAINNNGR